MKTSVLEMARRVVVVLSMLGVSALPRLAGAEERNESRVSPYGSNSLGAAAALAQLEKTATENRGGRGIGGVAVEQKQNIVLRPVAPAMLLRGLAGERAERAPAAQTVQSFIVWFENRTPLNFEIRLYWIDSLSSDVKQTGGVVYGGQVAPFITSACGQMVAYALDLFLNGEFYATTNAVQPDPNDGDLCSDAWAAGS